MTPSELLDLALNKLEGDDAARAARELEADPELADRADRLASSLLPFLDDGDGYDPPAGLGRRTIAFVETESRIKRPSILDFGSGRLPFRREDLAVAATILIASVLALAPAVLKGRERWGRAACQSNLQKVGMRLHQYAAINHAYPFVSTDEEVPHVGTIICRLNDAGFPINPTDLQCPCSGSNCAKEGSIPPLAQVAKTMKVSHEAGCKMIGANDYAFHIGYYPTPSAYTDPNAKAVPVSSLASHATPIVADRPAFDAGEVLQGNSPNHGGQGQNVLFADGHSAWHNTRQVTPADDDLFLNQFSRPAYGVGPEDAVLIPAVFKVKAH